MTKKELEIAQAACCVGTIWDQYEGTEKFNEMVGKRVQHLIELVRNHLEQEQPPTEREIAEAHHYAEIIRERDKARIQQEQPETKEQISHLEHWLAFFGCPEENIEKCATQIAQGYGAIRYLEGIRHGAEAVNELAQQEQPEVELEKDIDAFFDKWDKNSNGAIFDENGARVTIETIKGVVKHFLNTRKEK